MARFGAALGRLVAELAATASPEDVERALARARVQRSGGDITLTLRDAERGGAERGVAERGGDAWNDLREGEADTVRIVRGVYASLPTASARVGLLEAARRAARDAVELHVIVTDESSHLGRAVIDGPRRVLRLAGVRAAEPGDRFGPAAYAHCFFDEETLLDEVARAGLFVSSRRGFTFVLRDRRHAPAAVLAAEHAEPFAKELARVVRLVRRVDERRRGEPPERVVAAMRARGREARTRGPVGRARLRRAVGWVDALSPGGASCYRRILLEIALDAGAACETIVFGLDVGSTGHVAFEGREERVFDVSFAIPPERTRASERGDTA
jgi:hypothetical protein